MKKVVLLAAVVAGVLFAVKRSKSARDEAELWRQATAPSSGPAAGPGANGTVPTAGSKPDTARNN